MGRKMAFTGQVPLSTYVTLFPELRNTMSIPLTPTGVEHVGAAVTAVATASMSIPLTPTGVEHVIVTTRCFVGELHEHSFDADRR